MYMYSFSTSYTLYLGTKGSGEDEHHVKLECSDFFDVEGLFLKSKYYDVLSKFYDAFDKKNM